jgi:hypothetical protein
MKNILIKIIIPCLILVSNVTFAQFEFNNPSWYKASYNKLFVKVGNLDDSYTKEIIKIIEDNWLVCPVNFYTTNDIEPSNLVDGNLFLNVERYSIDRQKVRQSENFGTTYGAVLSNDYYYLNFWVTDQKYNSKKDINDYKFSVCRAELYLKTIGMGEEELKTFQITLPNTNMLNKPRKERFLKNYDFSNSEFEQFYCNGMSGNIKNIIQYVNRHIASKKEKKLLESLRPNSEISKLKNDTLFVPNYWFGPGGTMQDKLPPNEKMYKLNVKYVDGLIKSYPYKIKLITRPELNDMILNAKTDFYYLNYIQSSADKIMSVVNGLTGEIIYSEVTKLSYRPKDKDFEAIGKAAK